MKTAFITGAAQGIGLAIARRFAREGYQVGLFDINATRCQALLSEPDFQNAVAGYCDVRDSASIEEAIATFSQATRGGSMCSLTTRRSDGRRADDAIGESDSRDGGCQCDGSHLVSCAILSESNRRVHGD